MKYPHVDESTQKQTKEVKHEVFFFTFSSEINVQF